MISYSNPNSYDDTYFEATGAGTVLSLPALASLAPLQSYLHFQATQGGQVKAPALTSIGNPSQQAEYLQVYADGTGSEVDISGLTSLVVSTGSLTVTNQATVLDAGLTTLNGTSVTLDGTGTLAISQWTTLTSSSLTITAGSYTFPGLTDIDGSSLYAQANASLTLPAVTSYTEPNFLTSSTFEASGTGSVLSLPALTSIAETGGDTTTYVNALSGGDVQPALRDRAHRVGRRGERKRQQFDRPVKPHRHQWGVPHGHRPGDRPCSRPHHPQRHERDAGWDRDTGDLPSGPPSPAAA